MPPLTAFVGSSSARRGIADAILENLEGEVEITCWYHDFYQPTSSVFDDLLQQIGRFDFGIFIFAPDDGVEIRQESAASVRDNVLFELALSWGHWEGSCLYRRASGLPIDEGIHRSTWAKRRAVFHSRR